MPVWSTGGGSSVSPGGNVTVRFSCPTTVNVGDAVYVCKTPANTVDKACAGGVTKTPDAIGVVVAKPDPVTADVLMMGEAAVYAGLVVGDIYYLSPTTPGAITNVAPTTTAGDYVQEVGQAKSTSSLCVYMDPTAVDLSGP